MHECEREKERGVLSCRGVVHQIPGREDWEAMQLRSS